MSRKIPTHDRSYFIRIDDLSVEEAAAIRQMLEHCRYGVHIGRYRHARN